MEIERRTDGSEIFHNVNGDWVDIGGNTPDDANDLELVEQPPDGHPFATAADLAAAPIDAILEDETGNLIFKTASGRWWDEDGGVHRSESQLVWDGCWLTGEVDTRDAGRDDEDELEDELDNGYFGDEHDWN